jgi:hypothetical protein
VKLLKLFSEIMGLINLTPEEINAQQIAELMRPACSGDNRNRSKEVGVIDIN